MAQTLNVPTPEPPAHDPPTEPLHDLRGDPNYEPPPRKDPLRIRPVIRRVKCRAA